MAGPFLYFLPCGPGGPSELPAHEDSSLLRFLQLRYPEATQYWLQVLQEPQTLKLFLLCRLWVPTPEYLIWKSLQISLQKKTSPKRLRYLRRKTRTAWAGWSNPLTPRLEASGAHGSGSESTVSAHPSSRLPRSESSIPIRLLQKYFSDLSLLLSDVIVTVPDPALLPCHLDSGKASSPPSAPIIRHPMSLPTHHLLNKSEFPKEPVRS